MFKKLLGIQIPIKKDGKTTMIADKLPSIVSGGSGYCETR